MAQVQTATPSVGEQAPDFTLIDTDRNQVSLHDFRGSTVILVFFPAAFSGVCTRELCTFRDSMARLNQAHAQVLGISVDLFYALRQFKQEQRLDFPLLSDFDRRAVQAYGVVDYNFNGYTSGVALRSAFIIDPVGTIVWEWVAETQGQEPDYEEILQVVGS